MLPDPLSCAGSLFLLLIVVAFPCLVNGLGVSQAPPDQIEMSLRRRNAARRLLLERMQHVQDPLKAHRVDGPVGFTVKTIAKLQNPTKALHSGASRCADALQAALQKEPARSRCARLPEIPQVLATRADKDRGLDITQFFHEDIIAIYLYRVKRGRRRPARCVRVQSRENDAQLRQNSARTFATRSEPRSPDEPYLPIVLSP